jgi:hypothetical protein
MRNTFVIWIALVALLVAGGQAQEVQALGRNAQKSGPNAVRPRANEATGIVDRTPVRLDQGSHACGLILPLGYNYSQS